MALIGKIRNSTWIVLLFIGGGVALFILSEMTSGASGPLGPVMNRMGAVGETEIDRTDFERTASAAFSGGDAFQNRDQLWNFYVNEAVVDNQAKELGLVVSDDEIAELEFGNNPSPVIRRNFANPQTGQVNTQLLNQIKADLDNNSIDDAIEEGRLNPNFRPIWKYQRREIAATRMQEKMTALVSKAMYAPTWLAQEFANEQSGTRRVAVVKVPFTELDESDVTIADADVQTFVDENQSLFRNERETRQLSYVTFEVTPTDGDISDLRKTMTELSADWRKETGETNDSLFALVNNGSYQAAYVTADRIGDVVSDAVMAEMSVGDVYGPYQEGDALKLVKLIDRKVMADSAKGRLILRQGNTPEQLATAESMIDSLQNVLNRSPRKFTELAEEFNQYPGITDGVIAKATPGQYPAAIDNVLFGDSRTGTFQKVRAPFGWMLVETTSRSRSTSPRAKVAYVVEPIVPSTDTENAVLAKAQEFLNGKTKLADLKAAAEAAGMEVQTSAALPVSAYSLGDLGSGQDVRDMMCWAFSANEGDVSPVVYSFTDPQLFYQNKHVVIGLEDVLAKGLPTVSAAREIASNLLINRAKGQKLSSDIGSMDLGAIAAKYDVSVDTVSSNPTLASLPRVGAEPKVIAAAAAVATGSKSQPIVGNNGVYVVMPLNDAPTANSGNVPGARSQINANTRARSASALLPALRATADVADERAAADCGQ